MPGVAQQVKDVIAIYESSPGLIGYSSAPGGLTRRELAALVVSIMRLAGVTGFLHACSVILGSYDLATADPNFHQTSVWGQLKLDDDDSLIRYITECLRLDNPVTVTHRV